MLGDKGLKPEEANKYGDVLQKLLPVEVTAAYLALRTLFSQTGQISRDDVLILGIFSLLLAAGFYFILNRAFGVTSQLHRLFYCGCFLIWAANIETDKIAIVFYNWPKIPLIVGATTVLVSFVVPYYLPTVKLVKNNE